MSHYSNSSPRHDIVVPRSRGISTPFTYELERHPARYLAPSHTPAMIPRSPTPLKRVRFDPHDPTQINGPQSHHPSSPATRTTSSGEASPLVSQASVLSSRPSQDHQYAVGSRSARVLDQLAIPRWMLQENVPPQLNPLLRGDTGQQGILILDLSSSRFNPLHATSPGGTTGSSMSDMELSQPATFPAMTRMTIVHYEDLYGRDSLQWKVTLSPEKSRSLLGTAAPSYDQTTHASVFITVHDVLRAVHQVLHKQIRLADWRMVWPEKQRSLISLAYEKRLRKHMVSSGSPDPSQKQGIKWVDYLLEDCMFKGLQAETYDDDDEGLETVKLIVGK